MKTPPEDHDLIRWLDGEMSPAEQEAFSARLEADPALQMEYAEMKRISGDLRIHLPADLPVPYADFFNSQIQVRLAHEEAATVSLPEPTSWLHWLRTPSFLAASAAVLMAGVMIWKGQTTDDSLILAAYAPDPSVQARIFHSDEADATVLMLEGLEEMPADRKFVTLQISRSETDATSATTTMYDVSGMPLLVVTKDDHDHPLLLAATPRG